MRDKSVSSPGLLFGILLVVAGTVLLLDRMEILEAREWLRYWPLVLVAIGIGQLIQSQGPIGRVLGGILVAVGVLFQLDQLGDIRFHLHDAWPLLIVAFGLLLAWRAIEESRGGYQSGGAPISVLKHWAVFGGVHLAVTAQNFQGGEVLAVFGGCEIDLSKASMEGEQVTIEANAMFGGVELRVPDNWDVALHGAPIFGGYEDKTRHPKMDGAQNVKRLIVRGSAIFGGVEIKN
jgi:predicted membrane protein